MLADFYIAGGRNTQALAELAALCAQHQKDLEIRKTYVQLLLSNHRVDEAATLNAEILKKSPFDSQSLIASGQIEIEQKRFDSGAKILERALKSAPEDARGHYYLGLAYEQTGNGGQAENQWREAVRLRPDLIPAWRSLASTANRRADWSGLSLIAEQMMAHFPRDPEGYTFHATARTNQGDAATAERDFKQLINLFPESAIGYVELAQLRVYQKRWNEAEPLFRKGLSQEPTAVQAIRGLMNLYLAKNQSGKALDCIHGALDRDPQNPELYVLQAEAQLRTNDQSNAELSLTRSLKIDNHNINAWILLGQLQASLHRADDAITSHRKAIELAPKNASLQVLLGGLYEAQNNWQQAQDSYQKALALQPDHAIAANNLAYLLLEHGGDPNTALALAQTARRASPNQSSVADTLGWAYYRVGAYSAAAPLFLEAAKQSDKNLTYHYHLALTYQQMKDLARAREEFKKVITLDPNSSVAADARRAMTGTSGS
jgi:Flp pilus assembly protein TadD